MTRESPEGTLAKSDFFEYMRAGLKSGDLLDIPTQVVDSLAVLLRVGHGLALFALLSAIGAHWHILQSVAWTTMLAENLRTNSLPEAVERTFDGKHPCRLCKQIAKDKQAEKKSTFRPEWRRFEFSYAPNAFILAPPLQFWELRPVDTVLNPLTHAPPVPPPRSFSV